MLLKPFQQPPRPVLPLIPHLGIPGLVVDTGTNDVHIPGRNVDIPLLPRLAIAIHEQLDHLRDLPMPALHAVTKHEYRDPGLSVERIAREAGYSRHHFSRLFRRETGTSPHAHLQQFRLQRALDQITTTDTPIKQIALESGYRDYAYFCKEFKRWTHKTPRSARRLGDRLHLGAIHTA